MSTWNGLPYVDTGSGSKLVLLSPMGVTDPDPSMLALTANLTARGARVIGVHLPGLDGGSDNFGANAHLLPPFVSYIRGITGLGAPSALAQSRGGLEVGRAILTDPSAFESVAWLYPSTDAYDWPGDIPVLWSAWNKTQAEFAAIHDSVTPRKHPAAFAGIRHRFWIGTNDLVVTNTNAVQFAADLGAPLTLVQGMGHVWYFNREIADFLLGENPAMGTPYLEAHLQANLSLPAGGPTQFKFDQVFHDKDGNYDPSTGRFTAKVAGSYDVKLCSFITGVPAGNLFWVGIYKNGGPFAVDTKRGGDQSSQVNASIWLEAGDYIETFAYMGTAGAIESTSFATWLTIE